MGYLGFFPRAHLAAVAVVKNETHAGQTIFKEK
jgi:hypothetical protein